MQQGKWAAAESVFERMLAGRDAARPNGITLNYVLQYEVFYCLIDRLQYSHNILRLTPI